MRRSPRLFWTCALVLALVAFPAGAADPPKDKEDDHSSDPGNHIQVDLIEARTRLENDGTGESRLHLRFQVKSTQGRDWLSQVYFSYRPEFEALRYEGMRTLHPDGKVDEVSAADVIERDAPQQVPGIVHDVRVLGFAPRSLAVDDSVEFTVVRTSGKPIKPGDFWAVHDRLYPFPVRREVVVLDVPTDRAVSFWSDPAHPYTTSEDGGRRIRQWELSRESYRPQEHDSGEEAPPPLYRVSTLSEWSQVGGVVPRASRRTGPPQRGRPSPGHAAHREDRYPARTGRGALRLRRQRGPLLGHGTGPRRHPAPWRRRGPAQRLRRLQGQAHPARRLAGVRGTDRCPGAREQPA